MIGAGQTNNIVAKILQSNSFTNVHVFNRTLQKAEAIAKLFPNGKAYLLNDLESYAHGFDALIACTSSPTPLIDLKIYTSVVQNDKTPKVIIDLAVPNNIASDVASLKHSPCPPGETKIDRVLKLRSPFLFLLASSVDPWMSMLYC